MRFGSLFSGVGGFDLGFERAGMECAWQCEIDQKASAVLAAHWPAVPRHTDVREIGANNLGAVDLVCGGFPCQDLSLAGKRAGLAGERSGLWWEYRRILAELQPEWCVIENVPGLLSSNRGADLAVILQALVELGYGVAYRILDAQYFGVAQRRRRVFIVGHLGDGRASQVLFESESLCRDTAPSREAGKGFAGTLGGGAGERGWAPDTDRMTFVPTYSVRTAQTGSNGWGIQEDAAYTLDGASQAVAQPFTFQSRNGRGQPDDVVPALRGAEEGDTADSKPPVAHAMAVRRLTPTECERLQGFPDGWTAGQADSARYKQMGNAVCVPVAEWIGRRIHGLG